MNQRIIELAREAGFELNPAHFDHERFAELIVRDVVEEIRYQERTWGEWYESDIFKHFGIQP